MVHTIHERNLELSERSSHHRDRLESSEEHVSHDDASLENISHQLRPLTKRVQAGVLISSFLTICITIGFNQSYGVFQRAYVSNDDGFWPADQAANGALVAFVGTLGTGLTWACSVFVNPWMERVSNTRYITVLGVLLMSLGFGLASLSTQVRTPPPPPPRPVMMPNRDVDGAHLDLAPPPHPRSLVWRRFIDALLPHPQRCA